MIRLCGHIIVRVLLNANSQMSESFFGYSKRYSVTQMLLELSLPSLNTTIANGHALAGRISVACNNRLVQFVCLLGLVL